MTWFETPVDKEQILEINEILLLLQEMFLPENYNTRLWWPLCRCHGNIRMNL